MTSIDGFLDDRTRQRRVGKISEQGRSPPAGRLELWFESEGVPLPDGKKTDARVGFIRHALRSGVDDALLDGVADERGGRIQTELGQQPFAIRTDALAGDTQL